MLLAVRRVSAMGTSLRFSRWIFSKVPVYGSWRREAALGHLSEPGTHVISRTARFPSALRKAPKVIPPPRSSFCSMRTRPRAQEEQELGRSTSISRGLPCYIAPYPARRTGLKPSIPANERKAKRARGPSRHLLWWALLALRAVAKEEASSGDRAFFGSPRREQ
jgi:hypothetical protein